jgi:hypothetical protein
LYTAVCEFVNRGRRSFDDAFVFRPSPSSPLVSWSGARELTLRYAGEGRAACSRLSSERDWPRWEEDVAGRAARRSISTFPPISI